MKTNDIELVILREQVGSLLRLRRNRIGMTQQQVADEVKIARRLLGHYETAIILPPLDVLIRLGDVLDINYKELLPERPR